MNKLLLKNKIAIIVLVIGIISALIIGGVVYWYLDGVLIQNKKSEVAALTIEQARELNRAFANNQLFVKMLGTRTRVKEYLLDQSEARRSELEGIFQEYVKDDPKYLAIYLLDHEGLALISTDKRFVGQNYDFRSYFQEAINGKPLIDALIGKTSQQFGYYFSYPVFNDDKQVIGVMVVKVSAYDINDSLLQGAVIKDNVIMLADKLGVILFSNQADRVLMSLGTLSDNESQELTRYEKFSGKSIRPLRYEAIQKEIRNYSQPKTIELFDADDNDREVFTVAKIDNFPFYLIAETRLENITRQVLPIVLVVLLVILIGLFVKSVSIYYAVATFLRPLEQFKQFANRIAAGDFSKKVTVKSGDELEELSISVNRMAENLNDLYKNLDQKVRVQTREIDIKAQEAEKQKKAILNILEDVAEEKGKTELLAKDLEKFKLAVDNASDHIVITDPDGVILYANQGVERITGFKTKEIIGQKAGNKQNWGGLMDGGVYKNLWDTIKNKRQVFVGDLKNRRKNGQDYEVKASISPILDAAGRVVFFVGIERDITKEKEVDKAKTEFVSLASHQLRTPLSAINWYTEMLLNGDAGKINQEQKQYLEEVYRGNQRMVELVNSLLNVSRLELGTFIIEPTPMDLIKAAQEVIKELLPQIRTKGLALKEVYDKKIEKYNADPKLVKIIFQNLLSNAVKYTPENGKIYFSISQDNKSVLIEVKDNGYGITESQQDKIFTKLFRADNVRERDTEGTGLGLYLVKSIVDSVNGRVWFESKENKGTTFYVSLPLAGMKKKEGTKTLN